MAKERISGVGVRDLGASPSSLISMLGLEALIGPPRVTTRSWVSSQALVSPESCLLSKDSFSQGVVTRPCGCPPGGDLRLTAVSPWFIGPVVSCAFWLLFLLPLS